MWCYGQGKFRVRVRIRIRVRFGRVRAINMFRLELTVNTTQNLNPDINPQNFIPNLRLMRTPKKMYMPVLCSVACTLWADQFHIALICRCVIRNCLRSRAGNVEQECPKLFQAFSVKLTIIFFHECIHSIITHQHMQKLCILMQNCDF